MDSNIVIRSLMVSDGTVSAHAGGGIVADSNPADEYEEMRTKAAPLLASVTGEAGS
jgi:para-aminobenzoate synthetase component 1